MIKHIYRISTVCAVILSIACRHLCADQFKEFRQKEHAMETLLERAAALTTTGTLSHACHEFADNPAWRPGDLFIFMVGPDGRCRVFGDAKELIQYDFKRNLNIAGKPLFDEFLRHENKAVSFGYATQDFHNRIVYARLKKISRDGNDYILGCGFYISDSLYAAIALTRKAAGIMESEGITRALEIINNPLGKMMIGDVYLFVIDNNGFIVAHGRDRARIGHHLFDNDPSAAYFQRRSEDVTAFVTGNQIHYLTEASPLTVDQIYMEKYTDPHSHIPYIIGAVFHPSVNEEKVTALVHDAIAFLKDSRRPEAALNEITFNHARFKLGGSFVSVYDFNGLCLAHGEYPLYVGTNRKNIRDEFGQNPLKHIIKTLETTRSIRTATFVGNAPKSVYAERVDLPEISLIVTSGFWPSSQKTHIKYMVENAAQLIEEEGLAPALEHIALGKADFLQGQTFPIICNNQGIALFEGPYNKNSIWQPLAQRDKSIRDIIKKTIAKGNAGGGWLKSKQIRGTSNSYVKKIVSGEDELFITAYYYN